MIEPVDFIVPLGTGSLWHDDELRLLLRSIEKYAIRCRRIIVVASSPPEWLTNVKVILRADTFRHNKDGNIIRKVVAAAKASDISKNFVWSCDDCVLLQPLDLANLPPIQNRRRKEHFPVDGSRWQRRVRRTFELFEARGVKLECNFESHTPQRFPTADLLKVLDGIDYASGIGYSINTLFYGLLGFTRGIDQELLKDTNESRGSALVGKPICGYNDDAFATGLREKLFRLFPNPSKYEKV